MRIFLISNYADSIISFRGALISEFAERGHEVIVCAPGQHKEVAGQLRSIGAEYRAVRLDRTGLNPLKDIRFLRELVRLFRNERPDIVISYTIKPVIYASIAARMVGISNVYSVITGLGYVFTGKAIKQRLLRIVATGMYKKALAANKAIFFLNGDDLALFLESSLVQSDKHLELIDGEGLDLDYYSYTARDLDHPVFLLIARLLRDKGIIEYFEAARVLKQRYPNASFRLLGPLDRNPTAIQLSQVKAWQESGIIDYLGETKDVRPFIADASVYVLPSYREGIPRTVLEAMAMGLPIVTTDAPGCRETVKDGENGFLVPVKDAQSLALAMERFIMNPGLIATMGKRSREIAEQKYDVRKINRVILNTLGLADEKGV